MANKMLIDASHPEETRVVVVKGNRVEEFDFEAANRKQLRGNIYLAKVTRVEPSLQAAFVEYGGNRHGFLAFSEIHPDYYQIPVADREALLAEDLRADRDADFGDDDKPASSTKSGRGRGKPKEMSDAGAESIHSDMVGGESTDAEPAEGQSEELSAETVSEHHSGGGHSGESGGPVEVGSDEDQTIEQIGGGDALEEVSERPRQYRRQYKIQEVIKRRQILLVQVVKEERGNKGAALTTYLSLAGRYSVLMPNTGRGGGISRKITNIADRKRLKAIAQELEVPDGMGVILRTAGAARTKPEIKRDFEYLMRAWETVRETTLQSTAPTLVYEEGSLVKRSIRDLYNKDIDEVIVAGEESYKDAKDFMRMLMPSHAKNVKPYRETTPIFAKFGVEAQLDAMFSSQVTLKSGGYIVINQTEALVAIDVNSGRSTREHNIEDTAVRTNLEAADEVARQLRLRDLAGLIVIDFIDMEENRNNRAVERRLKDALKNDRARIQVGRISPFGLMEMSRQRIRTGVLEGSTVLCPHCAGSGMVRATPSVALHVLRNVEEMLLKSATHHVTVKARADIALYVLNQKRMHLRSLEETFLVNITVLADDSLTGTHPFNVERGDLVMPGDVQIARPINPAGFIPVEEPEIDDIVEEIDEEEDAEPADNSLESDVERRDRSFSGDSEGGEAGRRRRRRRRRRGGQGGERSADGPAPMPLNAPQPDVTGSPFTGTHVIGEDGEIVTEHEVTEKTSGEGESGRRRRGRRGGRRNGRRDRAESTEMQSDVSQNADFSPSEGDRAELTLSASEDGGETPVTEVVKKPRGPRRPRTAPVEPSVQENSPDHSVSAPVASPPLPPAEPVAPAITQLPEPITTEPVVIADPNKPKKGGWWAKAKATLSGE
jgi:ribonuclease E